MTTATPTRPKSQRLDALEIANAKRSANAQVLDQLSRVEISLEAALEMECVSSTRLKTLLAALPKTNRRPIKRSNAVVSAEKIGRRAGIDISRKAGSISCQVTRKALLDAAYDVTGRTAWIYTVDPVPKQLPPTRHGAKVKAAARKQREEAYSLANEVKAERLRVRRQLSSGEITLEEALRDPCSQKWEIEKILRLVPVLHPDTGEALQLTPGRASRVLKISGLRGTKTAGSLTERQIETLVAVADRHFRFAKVTGKRGRYTKKPVPA